MRVLVLLAGILDPKRPLLRAAVDEAGQEVVTGLPSTLSPFDESALEVALKLRDALPQARIDAALLRAGGDRAADEALARQVAAQRTDEVFLLQGQAGLRWDLGRLAAVLGGWIRSLEPAPAVVLLGREFGDRDDGTLAAALAEVLGRPLFAHASAIDASAGMAGPPGLVRSTADGDEQVRLDVPVVASITNDRGNRLRHPLMKNVAAARRMSLTQVDLSSAGRSTGVVPVSAALVERDARAVAGRRLEGSLDERVDELAAFLADWSAAR